MDSMQGQQKLLYCLLIARAQNGKHDRERKTIQHVQIQGKTLMYVKNSTQDHNKLI